MGSQIRPAGFDGQLKCGRVECLCNYNLELNGSLLVLLQVVD